METVKLMVEIDKDDYNFMMECCPDLTDLMKIYEQIKNGTIITEQEPTTKNDLGVDCIVDVLGSYTDLDIPYKHEIAENILTKLPSVTPQAPRCKDCKWWKDSDGTYRRGCGAESICRINTDKVYQGEGYCYLFKPQESEDNK